MDDHSDGIELAVVGAHLRGQPLHHQLADRHAILVEVTTTAQNYHLYALDTAPPKPGLVRCRPGDEGTGAIEVEVYRLDAAEFGTFVAAVPPPLAIGTISLADGRNVPGFVCEPIALDGAHDITRHGGWRAYLQSLAAPG